MSCQLDPTSCTAKVGWIQCSVGSVLIQQLSSSVAKARMVVNGVRLVTIKTGMDFVMFSTMCSSINDNDKVCAIFKADSSRGSFHIYFNEETEQSCTQLQSFLGITEEVGLSWCVFSSWIACDLEISYNICDFIYLHQWTWCAIRYAKLRNM